MGADALAATETVYCPCGGRGRQQSVKQGQEGHNSAAWPLHVAMSPGMLLTPPVNLVITPESGLMCVTTRDFAGQFTSRRHSVPYSDPPPFFSSSLFLLNPIPILSSSSLPAPLGLSQPCGTCRWAQPL